MKLLGFRKPKKVDEDSMRLMRTHFSDRDLSPEIGTVVERQFGKPIEDFTGKEIKNMGRREFIKYSAIIGVGAAVISGVPSYLAGKAAASPAPVTPSVIEKGSMVTPAQYIVYRSGTDFLARNGLNGQNDFDFQDFAACLVGINTLGSTGLIAIKGDGTTFTQSQVINVLKSSTWYYGISRPKIKLANGVNSEMFIIGNGSTPFTDVIFDGLDLDGNYLNNPTNVNGILNFNGPPNGVNSTPMRGMRVSNSIIHDGIYRGIYYFCTADSVAYENLFYNNLFGVDVNSTFQNFSIEASGDVITRNVFRNQRAEGLISSLCANCIYSFNICHNNTKSGITLDSAFQLTCEGNECYGNSVNGILNFTSLPGLGGNYNQILNNQVYANAQHGIQNHSTASRTTILGNQLRSNSQSAGGTYDEIQNAGTRCLICNNNIISDNPTTSRYNIAESAGASLNLITGNYCGGGGTGTILALPGIGTRATNNYGYNPIGKINLPFGTTIIGPVGGSSASPTASTDYVVDITEMFITVTGGTGVSITIKDNLGNTIASGLTSLVFQYLPAGYKINFGAFSVAPTVTASFN